MSDMYFENLPNTTTPLNKTNLDKLNDIKVSPTEPTTGEKVWMQTGNTKKIYTKNDNDEYEEFCEIKENFIFNAFSGNTARSFTVNNFTSYLVTVNKVASGNILESVVFLVATGENSTKTSKITNISASVNWVSVTCSGSTLTITPNNEYIHCSVTKL